MQRLFLSLFQQFFHLFLLLFFGHRTFFLALLSLRSQYLPGSLFFFFVSSSFFFSTLNLSRFSISASRIIPAPTRSLFGSSVLRLSWCGTGNPSVKGFLPEFKLFPCSMAIIPSL